MMQYTNYEHHNSDDVMKKYTVYYQSSSREKRFISILNYPSEHLESVKSVKIKFHLKIQQQPSGKKKKKRKKQKMICKLD